MKTKKIEMSIIRAKTIQEAIKIAKKGHKYFEFIKGEQITCFEIYACIEVGEASAEVEKEILGK